jgi:hypothetical protein
MIHHMNRKTFQCGIQWLDIEDESIVTTCRIETLSIWAEGNGIDRQSDIRSGWNGMGCQCEFNKVIKGLEIRQIVNEARNYWTIVILRGPICGNWQEVSA